VAFLEGAGGAAGAGGAEAEAGGAGVAGGAGGAERVTEALRDAGGAAGGAAVGAAWDGLRGETASLRERVATQLGAAEAGRAGGAVGAGIGDRDGGGGGGGGRGETLPRETLHALAAHLGVQDQAGSPLETSTRPTLNPHLLLRPQRCPSVPIHPEGTGKSCSELGSSACSQRPSRQARLMQSCKALREGLRGAFAPSEIVLNGNNSTGVNEVWLYLSPLN